MSALYCTRQPCVDFDYHFFVRSLMVRRQSSKWVILSFNIETITAYEIHSLMCFLADKNLFSSLLAMSSISKFLSVRLCKMFYCSYLEIEVTMNQF